MTKICFLLLCHKNPAQIIEQAEMLTGSGDYVSIHFDARASTADFKTIQAALSENRNVCFANRVKCGWGEWSLVQGTLNALKEGFESFPESTHFYMLSGDCMPIKSVHYMHEFLSGDDRDYIDHHDFFESDWIKVGLKEERLIYRHWLNERKNKFLFYASVNVQRALGLGRNLPEGLQMMIGSQWWCLRRSTISKLLKFLDKRPDISRFFKTTWIPDETFFQTLVMHLIPRNEVESRTLTFLSFSDYGIPTVFYKDHLDFLLSQDFLFARKISPQADGLIESLSAEFQSEHSPQTGPDGKRLITYMNSRGRSGNRYSERFWERGSRVGRQNTLNVILCKKWHVGKKFAEEISKANNSISLGYIFDESGINLPDLGQLEHSRQKRNRHRRAFLKLLYERLETDNLTICMDPSNLETITDIAGDRCELRVLDVACIFSDEYLSGHAERIGLANKNGTDAIDTSIISALRNNIRTDHESLREMDLASLYLVDEKANDETNSLAIAEFMRIPQQRADQIVQSVSYD